MSAKLKKELDIKVEKLVSDYYDVSHNRHLKLFTEFLYQGYQMTTVDIIDQDIKESIVLAKMHLGMIITLFDDLADNPAFSDNELLKVLYMLPFVEDDFRKGLSSSQLDIYNLSRRLVKGMNKSLQDLPNYEKLKEFFLFDLEQVFSANKYSSLITSFPKGASSYESSRYGAFNMGIVAAGMIDLMGAKDFDLEELGAARVLFHHGQRFGRISNVITTFEREVLENDVTNEIYIKEHLDFNQAHKKKNVEKEMEEERAVRKEKMSSVSSYIKSFSGEKYIEGIESLHELHLRMKGII